MGELTVVNQPNRRSGALIDQIARRIRRQSETVLEPLGLRSRHLVALTVLRDQGRSSQQSLATTLLLDSTNVVGLLNTLEADGLVARLRSETDRRKHFVELTEAGNNVLARAEFALAAVEDEILAALGQDERDLLYELLRRATSTAEQGATAADCAADPD